RLAAGRKTGLLERDDLAIVGGRGLALEFAGEKFARLLHAAVILINAAAGGIAHHLGFEPGSVGRGNLVIEIKVEQLGELGIFHLKSSPSLLRRLSRARAIRLFTVPTEIPSITAISS